jgi:hypothetical protein
MITRILHHQFRLGAVCAALIFSGSIHAGLVTVGANQNLTRYAGNQYEAAVTFCATNSQLVFMASRNELGGLYTARSTNAGLTWTNKLIGQSAIASSGDIPRAYGNTSVAWDAFGNLFVAFLSQSSSKSAATYVALAVSKDGGQTFYAPYGTGPAIVLPAVTPAWVGDQPTVTVGPGVNGIPGSVWLTYWSNGGILASGANVSSSGTVSNFVSQILPSQPAGVNFGDIAIGPNGEVAVTYGPNSSSTGSLYLQVNTNGVTGAFSAPLLVANVNLGGFSYIPAQPDWGIDPEAGLAWDRTSGAHRGRIYFVFTDAPFAGSADTDIYVVTSDNLGQTWSPRVRVNDDPGTNSQFLPRISLDQTSGNVAVTWYDCRNSISNNTAQYFGAISTNGGASFGANFQISAGTSYHGRSVNALKDADFGDYTGNAFANGVLIPAWADNSNTTGDNPDGATNFDVYTALVYVLPPLGMTHTRTNLTLAWPTNAAGYYLQENSGLTAAGWTNNTAVPQIVNGLNQVSFTTTNSQRFYRLKHP